uniref:phosphate ABC transporter permease subunit PstC n=1 Tax=Ezakiella massiliensis TaxID=1852374 RepID=UPI00094F0912|nr:phosphate ABC transporter permease subunit PstC [Ezakiella massiliensis]
MKRKDYKENIMKGIFMMASAISVVAFLFICYFIFKNGVPFIGKVGVKEFLFGTNWNPGLNPPSYGILPMIFGSFYITILAALIGVPIAIFSAIFLTWEANGRLHRFLKPMVDLMAGVPSIVYGFFALQIIVPLIRIIFPDSKGTSILAAGILLAIMILPTIISIAEASLRAVSKSYYEASVALGASHSRTIMKIMVPAARSGLFAAIILGIGRAIGETMAVVLVAGNQARITYDITKGIRTMTTNVVLEMAYSSGDHQLALIATATVLFVFILLINGAFLILKNKGASNGK